MPSDIDFIGERMTIAVQAILGQVPKDYEKQFKLHKTNEARVRSLLSLPCVHNVLTLESEYAGKCEEEAQQHRQQGNKYFQKKSFMSAMDEYRQGLCMAPQGGQSNEVSLIYGNRSAALLHLKRYNLCLQDTQMAIKHQYSKDLIYKLYDRRGKCFVALSRKTEALESFIKARECLDSADLMEEVKAKWIATLDKQVAQCEGIAEEVAQETPTSLSLTNDGTPTLQGDALEYFSNLSSAVDVNANEKRGRHLTSNRELKPGDVIVSETPFTSVLGVEYFGNHCYQCLSLVRAPIPCVQCSSVVYCSSACQKKSWEDHHSYECSCMALLSRVWCGRLGHLVARVVMKVGWRNIVNYAKSYNEDKGDGSISGCDSAGLYRGDYHSVYNLVANMDQRTPECLFDFAVFGVFLLKALQCMRYIKPDDLDDNTQAVVGGAMMTLIINAQCNAIEIMEIQSPTYFDDPKPMEIGIGFYPSHSLINHSCYPNSDVVFYADKAVCRATKFISAEEEITISYGPHVLHMAKKQRFFALKFQYAFDCKCIACVKNWPLWKEMEADVPEFICSGCKCKLQMKDLKEKRYIKCGKCQEKNDINEVTGALQSSHDQYSLAMENVMHLQWEKALSPLIGHLHLLQNSLAMPWRDMAACQAAIQNCYRLMANCRN